MASERAAVHSSSDRYTEFPRRGSAADDTSRPQGPGQIVMGGGRDVDAAFAWAQTTVAGHGRGGDIVVLRASGTNAYDDYLLGVAGFNSAQTLLIPPGSTASQLAAAATIVSRAEVVFFAGGDQANYVAWQGTPLARAVAGVYRRGGVVGGTSAGAAVQGEYVYDSIAADRVGTDVHTEDAVADPFEASISFTRDPFAFTPLTAVIVDPHFHNRDRLGRLATFMARVRTHGTIVGLGVDQGNALVVDKLGRATLQQQVAGSGAAYVLLGGRPDVLARGETLLYTGIEVHRLTRAGQTYNLVTRCGSGVSYRIDVDGNDPTAPYSPADPYAASGTTVRCAD